MKVTTTATAIKVMTNTAAVAQVNPFNSATLAAWIQYCDVKPATQVTYNKAVQCFVTFLAENWIKNPVREDVINFRKWMIDEVENENGDKVAGDNAVYKVSTARMYLVVVKKFFSWLASQGLYLNVADNVKLPVKSDDEHARDALTLNEAKAALAYVNEKANKEMQFRDKAIISLMIGCGLRSVEVTRLNEGDLEKRKGVWFLNVRGKGKDAKKSVQLTGELKRILDDYRAARGYVKKNAPMFISTSRSNRGARLQTQTISRMAKKTFAAIGSESSRITCHSCRHTFITLALQAGISIREVARAARHSSPSTTEIYAHDLDRFNNQSFKVVTQKLFS